MAQRPPPSVEFEWPTNARLDELHDLRFSPALSSHVHNNPIRAQNTRMLDSVHPQTSNLPSSVTYDVPRGELSGHVIDDQTIHRTYASENSELLVNNRDWDLPLENVPLFGTNQNVLGQIGGCFRAPEGGSAMNDAGGIFETMDSILINSQYASNHLNHVDHVLYTSNTSDVIRFPSSSEMFDNATEINFQMPSFADLPIVPHAIDTRFGIALPIIANQPSMQEYGVGMNTMYSVASEPVNNLPSSDLIHLSRHEDVSGGEIHGSGQPTYHSLGQYSGMFNPTFGPESDGPNEWPSNSTDLRLSEMSLGTRVSSYKPDLTLQNNVLSENILLHGGISRLEGTPSVPFEWNMSQQCDLLQIREPQNDSLNVQTNKDPSVTCRTPNSMVLQPGIGMGSQHHSLDDNFEIYTKKLGPKEPAYKPADPKLGKKSKYGRNHPLELEQKEKAAKIRGMHACWLCRLQRAGCGGKLCHKGMKNKPPDLPPQVWLRPSGSDFLAFFFDPLYVSHHDNKSIEERFTPYRWTGETISVAMQFNKHSSFLLPVTCLKVSDGLLNVGFLEADANNQKYGLQFHRGLPLGIRTSSVEEINKKLLSFIDGLNVKKGLKPAQKGTNFFKEILHAISGYLKDMSDKNTPLVKLAARVQAISYCTGRWPYLSRISAERACSRLGINQEALEGFDVPTSRFINAQLKYCLNILRHQHMSSFLRMLLKQLRDSRSAENWVVSFLSMIILCSSVEAVQIGTASGVLLYETSSADMKTQVVKILEVCRRLDCYVFQIYSHRFHALYRTHNPSFNRQRGKGFNPLGDPYFDRRQLNDATLKFVDKVRKTIQDHYDQMRESAEKNPFEADMYSTECTSNMMYGKIREQLQERLLSKFLLSFL